MDGRRDWDEKLGRGRGPGRRVWVSYLSTAAAVAIVRVALLVWVNHRIASHTMTETVWYFSWGVYPEALLSSYIPPGVLSVSWTRFLLVFGSLLTVGSFLMATPILLVGWLVRRHR